MITDMLTAAYALRGVLAFGAIACALTALYIHTTKGN